MMALFMALPGRIRKAGDSPSIGKTPAIYAHYRFMYRLSSDRCQAPIPPEWNSSDKSQTCITPFMPFHFPDSRTLRNHRVRWAMFTRPDSQPHHRDAGLASAGPLSSLHIAVAALIEGFAGIARIHSVAGYTGGRSVFRGCLGSGQRNLSRIVSSSLPSREMSICP